MVNKNSIAENFEELGFDADDDVLSIDLCSRYKIDESAIVDEWVSYSVRGTDDMKLSVDNLSLMERARLLNKPITTPNTRKSSFSPSTPIYSTCDSNWSVDNGFDSEYLKNIEEANRSEIVTDVKTPINVRFHLNNDSSNRIAVHTPRTLFSPASVSPAATEQSRKYKERTNAGLVLSSFGPNAESNMWKTSNLATHRVSLSREFSHIPNNAQFMFENIGNFILASKKIADTICLEIIEKNNVKFPVEIHQMSIETTTYAGRIKCDSNGKLNTSSIILESCLFDQRGENVQLQVTDLPHYSLFPGQIVVIEGKNPTGTKIMAERLFADVKLPLCPITPKEFLEPRDPMHIVVAAGPFTNSDTLSYQPWEDLQSYIMDHKPDVVILIGPVVDCLHQRVLDNSISEPFLLFLERQLGFLLNRLQDSKTHTKVVFVSSWREAGQFNVYPTPCIHTKLDKPNLLFAPDPCLLDINGFQIGATSADILMDLGKEELYFSNSGPILDRLGRLASHLLLQKNFYPLMPPAEEISVDYGLFLKHAMLPFVPHMMIVPSELKHFIKNINGSVFVNPEKLAKGQAGGSFSRIEVSSVTDGKAWAPESHVSVQVIKI